MIRDVSILVIERWRGLAARGSRLGRPELTAEAAQTLARSRAGGAFVDAVDSWLLKLNLAELPRAYAVLELAAAAIALEIIPLFGVAGAHTADVAAEVAQWLIAQRTLEHRRRDRRRRRLVAAVQAAEVLTPHGARAFDQPVGFRQLVPHLFADGASAFPQGGRLLQQALDLCEQRLRAARF